MLEQASIFKKWVPEKLIVPFLGIAMMPYLMVLMIFNMNSTFTASFLDLEVDDLQFLFSLAYATIVCGFFVHERLFHFFNIRNYLLVMTMLNILVLFAMTLTKNTELILILRFIQGPISLFEGVILVPIIISRIKHENAKLIAYSMFYCVILCGDKITTLMVKFAIQNYNYNMIIYTIMSFHVLSLSIYVLFFNQNRMYPQKPLYQLNLGGVFLMSITLISGAFWLIYGKKYFWFESPLIVISFVTTFIFSGLFIYHQKTSRRPLFHFEILKSKRLVIGLLLFFVFYTLRASMSNIYQIMAVVWKWPWEYVLNIQFYNVAGTVTGVMISFLLVKNKIEFRYIFCLGFLVLSASMLWFSYLFFPDTRTSAVVPVLFLEGVGQGMLFTPLILFIIGSVHPTFSGNAAHAGIAIRFWTTTIAFSIMQNAVLHLTTKHQFLMTKNLDKSSPIFQEQWSALYNKNISSHLANEAELLSFGTLKSRLFNQALLVSNMEIFRVLFVVGLSVAIILILKPLKTKIYNR
ncbi:hypothetical protein [Chishuiella sp.]|uniref:hypothetical protein n=1 Tax=Chishuiella sp. TaxID=1969467 RepID=UPI0028A8AA40|nr:hypothetical protein [Chishuiella sp.]